MKLTPKGFTLVELMIVIAIIGVLAAALFPAMSGYMSRSRDTSRISHVGQIMTAASTYFQDRGSFSGIQIAATPNCLSSGALNRYMNFNTPQDTGGRNHCSATITNVYGAGTGFINGLTSAIAISAMLENKTSANTGVLTAYQGTVTSVNMNAIGTFEKNPSVITTSTGGYVIVR